MRGVDESSEKVIPDVQYFIARAVLMMKSGMIRADGRSIPNPPLDMVTCEMCKLCSAMWFLFMIWERKL